jgi:uncharacterized protein (TIGR00369 family)
MPFDPLPPLRRREIERVFHTAPFIQRLGIRLRSASPGRCQTELVLREDHLQQDGFVHAGVQSTLADHTAGTAAATLTPDGHIVLTADVSISLMRAARGDKLRCRARVLKPGRRLSFVESEVFCETADGEVLVSKAKVAIAVVPAPPSEEPPGPALSV